MLEKYFSVNWKIKLLWIKRICEFLWKINFLAQSSKTVLISTNFFSVIFCRWRVDLQNNECHINPAVFKFIMIFSSSKLWLISSFLAIHIGCMALHYYPVRYLINILAVFSWHMFIYTGWLWKIPNLIYISKACSPYKSFGYY